MFIQIIEGSVGDPATFQAALDKWDRELAPGATGFLGSTSGVTDDGLAVVIARFESRADAQANSSRPEQDSWWAETAKLFTDTPIFRDSEDVVAATPGNPDTAGFVQVIHGAVSDPVKFREMAADSAEFTSYRPDIVGSLGILHEGDEYSMVLWFTSETDARIGEKKEIPPELAEQFAEMDKLEVGLPTFLDLHTPRTSGPR